MKKVFTSILEFLFVVFTTFVGGAVFVFSFASYLGLYGPFIGGFIGAIFGFWAIEFIRRKVFNKEDVENHALEGKRLNDQPTKHRSIFGYLLDFIFAILGAVILTKIAVWVSGSFFDNFFYDVPAIFLGIGLGISVGIGVRRFISKKVT